MQNIFRNSLICFLMMCTITLIGKTNSENDDHSALAIVCPTTPATVQLGPGDCRAQVFFDDPIITGCADPSLNAIMRSDNAFTTNINGGCVPDEIFEPIRLVSGSYFEIGVTTIEWEITDCGVGPFICSIDIEVLEYQTIGAVLACNDLVNFSLVTGCCQTITADELLEGNDIRCGENYTIIITDDAGNDFGSVITGVGSASLVGGNYNYTIIDPVTGNSCWGAISVEDKVAPELNCIDVTISCGDDPDPFQTGFPITDPDLSMIDANTFLAPNGDNCGLATLTFEDEENDENCITTDFISSIERTWFIEDQHGKTATCTQMIFVEKLNLPIVFPPNFDGVDMPALACEDMERPPASGQIQDSIGWNANEETGRPSPFNVNYTGVNSEVVMWHGTGFPTGVGCGNFDVDYTDTVIDICDQTYKILRKWRVIDQCNGGLFQHTQLIKVADDFGPLVVCADEPFFGLTGHDCTGDAVINPPTVVFDCSDNFTYTIAFLFADNDGNPPINGLYQGDDITFDISEQATITDLPHGRTWLRYTVTDGCGNSENCFTEVTIEDSIPPTAVCDDETVVALSSTGEAFVEAWTFDDGSHDQCEDDLFFKVMRMSPCSSSERNFNDIASFCCRDINTETMVMMRVYDVDPGTGVVAESRHAQGGDLFGHFSDCMVSVLVQDKFAPVIQCLPDITVSCAFDINLNNLNEFGSISNNENNRNVISINDPMFAVDGEALDGYASDNCTVTIREMDSNANEFSCGNGSIVRNFLVTDNGGLTATCSQTIHIVNAGTFTINDTTCDNNDPNDNVIWPCDFTMELCGTELEAPEFDAYPQLVGEACILNTAVSFDDNNFLDGTGCGLIVRTWTVIDWCAFNGDNVAGVWTYNQKINLINTTAPVITSCQTMEFCIEDNTCSANVSILATATDDCNFVSELVWSYEVDLNSDGTIDRTGASSGYSNNSVAPGTHLVHWTVSDPCGNQSSCTQQIVVRDCKKPTFYCNSGLSTSFMDVPGQEPMVEIWANDLVIEATDNCDSEVSFAIVRNRDNPNLNPPSTTSLRFTCQDIADHGSNIIPVQIWVGDSSDNYAYCDVFVSLTVEEGECPEMGNSTMNFSGFINTEDQKPIDEVTVELMNGSVGSMVMSSQTNENGGYTFENIFSNPSYYIHPTKDNDHLNGVSTLDLVLIQRHILGMSLLDSPYKLIAADVNNSQSISAADLVQLRKLILGLTTELPNNDAWRFVNESYSFTDPNFPWPFEEVMDIHDGTMHDFIAIKIGDINDSYTQNFIETEIRNNLESKLLVSNSSFEKGQIINVPIRISSADDKLSGFQFDLNYNYRKLNLVGITELPTEKEGFLNATELGSIKTSWTDIEGTASDSQLFSLQFEALASGTLDQLLEISEEDLKAEAYDLNYNKSDIKITFENGDLDLDSSHEVVLFQNQPNPFKDFTKIEFKLPKAQNATLIVTDLTGKILVQKTALFTKGINQLTIDHKELNGPQMYIYRLQTLNVELTSKMLLLR